MFKSKRYFTARKMIRNKPLLESAETVVKKLVRIEKAGIAGVGVV